MFDHRDMVVGHERLNWARAYFAIAFASIRESSFAHGHIEKARRELFDGSTMAH